MTRSNYNNWTFTSTKVISNFGQEKVPQKRLRDEYHGITITCVPYRDFFEPGIPFDNGCRMNINFDKGFPADLLEMLSFIRQRPIKMDELNRQITLHFFIEEGDKVQIKLILNEIQNYLVLLIRRHHQDDTAMLDGISKLREFVLLPHQRDYLPVHSKQLFFGKVKEQIEYSRTLSTDEMINSTFGQSSHTAKKLSGRS
jgi:hypothetical protein